MIIDILKKLLPSSLREKNRKLRTYIIKFNIVFKMIFFAICKKLLIKYLTWDSSNTRAYEKLMALFFENRKIFTHPFFEYGEFLKYFDRYYELDSSAILRWRLTVFYAHHFRQDFKGMLNKMNNYLVTQKRLANELQLNTLNISISSINIFHLYNIHAYLDTHLKARILGLCPNTRIILTFKKSDLILNKVMLEYWKKYVTVISSDEGIEKLKPIMPYVEEDLSFTANINGKAVYIEHAKSVVQKEWEKAGKAPLLELTSEDKEFGWSQLEKMGIPRGSWFVSVHVRDAGYKQGSHLADDSDSYRNADIDTYLMAMKTIVDRGGYVIRVGDSNMKTMPQMKGVFDYALSDMRSNRLDVFLFSQCRFFVGVSSGPILSPILFGTPAIMTNFMPVDGRPHASNCLYMPKLLRYNDKNRLATFNEILSTDIGRMFNNEGYVRNNIGVIDNTSEEINDVVVEMMDVLDKKLTYTQEDNELQEKLNVLYRQYSGYGDMGRASKKFLEMCATKGLL